MLAIGAVMHPKAKANVRTSCLMRVKLSRFRGETRGFANGFVDCVARLGLTGASIVRLRDDLSPIVRKRDEIVRTEDDRS
jgi:hypothetical protein